MVTESVKLPVLVNKNEVLAMAKRQLKALKKEFPDFPLGLMQLQNSLAEAAGYKNFHAIPEVKDKPRLIPTASLSGDFKQWSGQAKEYIENLYPGVEIGTVEVWAQSTDILFRPDEYLDKTEKMKKEGWYDPYESALQELTEEFCSIPNHLLVIVERKDTKGYGLFYVPVETNKP